MLAAGYTVCVGEGARRMKPNVNSSFLYLGVVEAYCYFLLSNFLCFLNSRHRTHISSMNILRQAHLKTNIGKWSLLLRAPSSLLLPQTCAYERELRSFSSAVGATEGRQSHPFQGGLRKGFWSVRSILGWEETGQSFEVVLMLSRLSRAAALAAGTDGGPVMNRQMDRTVSLKTAH